MLLVISFFKVYRKIFLKTDLDKNFKEGQCPLCYPTPGKSLAALHFTMRFNTYCLFLLQFLLKRSNKMYISMQVPIFETKRDHFMFGFLVQPNIYFVTMNSVVFSL